jgi:PAS domain S-box-containing protein
LSNSLKHNLQTVFESGELLHVEDRFTLPDKELWLDTRLIPLKTESGEIKSILGISRDITDRKRAEEEIRKLSSAVEQSIDGIAIGDLEPKLTYVNDAFARMHGYSSEEMIGMKVVNLHNEEQMDEYKSGMNQIKTQGGWVGEIGHIRKDGTPFPTYMSVTLLKGADGKPTGILAAARDITERKQAEDALRESEGRFRALTESTSDWIWEVDENAVYTYTSPMIKELLGYEPEEIIGKIPFDLMTPEGVKRVAAEFGAIAEAQKPFERLENENLHKDGQILVLETSGVPIFDANGNFRGYRGIDRDITERKRAEEELEEKNEALKRFNKLAVGRELRMIELKKEINALLEDQDKEPRYKIAGES